MTERETLADVVPAGRGANPFDRAGVERGSDGISRYVPDEMMGEKVGAVTVPGPGFGRDAVIAHASDRIADFKVPQYLALRKEPLPRNPGGKVLKAQLREQTDWGKPLR